MTDEPVVERAPPLTDVAWSDAFVWQSLEVLFVCFPTDGAHHLRPIRTPTLRFGWGPDRDPAQIVVGAVECYEVTPMLIHSTWWRHQQGRLILTYVAAVAVPEQLSGSSRTSPWCGRIWRAGTPSGPPSDIDVPQVVEHAFRHLSWLMQDDSVVGETLANWVAFLDRYEPELFRAFGPAAS
jgi:hypothetical protein